FSSCALPLTRASIHFNKFDFPALLYPTKAVKDSNFKKVSRHDLKLLIFISVIRCIINFLIKKPHFTVGSFLNNINNFNPLQPSLKKEEVPLFFKEGLGVILKKIKPHSLP